MIHTTIYIDYIALFSVYFKGVINTSGRVRSFAERTIFDNPFPSLLPTPPNPGPFTVTPIEPNFGASGGTLRTTAIVEYHCAERVIGAIALLSGLISTLLVVLFDATEPKQPVLLRHSDEVS